MGLWRSYGLHKVDLYIKKDFMSQDECSASAFKEAVAGGESPLLIDVRNRADFEQWKIDLDGLQVMNVPYDELLADEWKSPAFAALSKTKPIVVVCYRGNSSHIVSIHLREQGFQARSLHGGMRAWGELYETHLIHTSKQFEIYQIARMGRGCLSYIIASDGKAMIVDPTRHLEPYLNLIKEKHWDVKLVVDTHAHADHISGGKAIAEQLGATYLLHPYDAVHPIDQLPATIHFSPLWAGQHLQLGKIELQVMHLPGHTLGNVALLLDNHFLFAGDTLFIESIGRPDLGGKGEAWTDLHYNSLKQLHALSEQIVLLPGHCKKECACKSLGEIKKQNKEFGLAQESQEVFKKHVLSHLPNFPEGYIDIKRINLGLIEVTEDRISKLEAGKNLCSISN